LKILQILPYQFYGGPESQIFSLAGEMTKQFQINTELVLFFGKKLRIEDKIIAENIATKKNIVIHWWPSPGIVNFRSTKKQIEVLFKAQNFSHLISSGYLCNLLVAHLDVKKVSYFHGWTGQSTKVKLYEKLDSLVLKYFNTIICVSERQNKTLLHYNKNVQLLQNSISDSHIINKKTKADLHERFSIQDNSQILVSLGRLSPEKAPDMAIKIMSSPEFKFKNIYWIWFGGGLDLEEQKNNAVVAGAEKLIFAGHEAMASSWLEIADIFIIPSRTEGLPVALLEAMLLKKAIVASKVGGIPEVIENQKSGLLCSADDVEAFKNAILLLVKDPVFRITLGQNAYNFVKENNSLEKQCKLWFEYISLI
jgi:glycosyltransferase involved in cell wall biosynthesis